MPVTGGGDVRSSRGWPAHTQTRAFGESDESYSAPVNFGQLLQIVVRSGKVGIEPTPVRKVDGQGYVPFVGQVIGKFLDFVGQAD